MACGLPAVVLIAAALAITVLVVWLAIRSVTFTTLLCGAFLVSSGTLLYLWAAGTSVPVIGTDIVLSPESHLTRGLIHGVLLLFSLNSVIVRRRARSPRTDQRLSNGRVLARGSVGQGESEMQMLLRTWTTTVKAGREEEYEAFARDVSLPMFRAAPGCCAALMTRDETGCRVLTVWQDAESIAMLEAFDGYRDTVARILQTDFLGSTQTTDTTLLHLAWAEAIGPWQPEIRPSRSAAVQPARRRNLR